MFARPPCLPVQPNQTTLVPFQATLHCQYCVARCSLAASAFLGLARDCVNISLSSALQGLSRLVLVGRVWARTQALQEGTWAPSQSC